MSLPFPRKRVPRGWRLIAVGEYVWTRDKVCMHPFDEWSPMGDMGHYDSKPKVRATGNHFPYGYYITQRKKK